MEKMKRQKEYDTHIENNLAFCLYMYICRFFIRIVIYCAVSICNRMEICHKTRGTNTHSENDKKRTNTHTHRHNTGKARSGNSTYGLQSIYGLWNLVI